MKILFVTSYPLEYNTSGNIRNLGLISGLIENGNSVSTLSPYPTDDTLFSGKLLDYPFEKRYWIGSLSKTVAIQSRNKLLLKAKAFLYKWNNAFAVYDRRRYLVKNIKEGLINEKFDIIISSSDPKSAHLYAEKLLKIDKSICKRWIQYWGDPFSNDISTTHSFSQNRVLKEERRLLELASKVIYVSPFTAKELTKKYPEFSEKITFLPIPFLKKQRTEVSRKGDTVVYLGDYFSKNRNIMNLVNVFKKEKIKSAIIGNSDLAIRPTEFMIVKERLAGKELENLIKDVMVYTCVCNLHGSQIPGKIYHYVDTDKPILVVIDGDNQDELKEYIESFDRFYICNNTEKSIANTLKTIFADNHKFSTPQSLEPTYIAEKFLL